MITFGVSTDILLAFLMKKNLFKNILNQTVHENFVADVMLFGLKLDHAYQRSGEFCLVHGSNSSVCVQGDFYVMPAGSVPVRLSIKPVLACVRWINLIYTSHLNAVLGKLFQSLFDFFCCQKLFLSFIYFSRAIWHFLLCKILMFGQMEDNTNLSILAMYMY